ncbi:unnamed protein product [Prorocentrum cordatum]|uniref:Uncharacterized protein n=1 Tax=Prorocentrum cordatum TaxID=2364126 RepID=A0ABN9SAQ9_9DINO|nr:unnamed protein product [Polarella glacialis]
MGTHTNTKAAPSGAAAGCPPRPTAPGLRSAGRTTGGLGARCSRDRRSCSSPARSCTYQSASSLHVVVVFDVAVVSVVVGHPKDGQPPPQTQQWSDTVPCPQSIRAYVMHQLSPLLSRFA